jgi:hypothetical protein
MLMGEAFAAAMALALIVSLLSSRSRRAGMMRAGAAAAVLGGVFAGLWVLGLLPHIPPHEAMDRLLVIVVPAAATAEVVAAASARQGWAARATVSVLAAPVLLHGSAYVTGDSRSWSLVEALLVFSILAVVLTVAWAAVHGPGVRTGNSAVLLSLSGATLGAAVVIMMSGYATGGQIGVPLGATLCGVAVVSMVRKPSAGTEAALGVGIVGLFALLVVGRLFADLTTLNAVLLFAAPLLGGLSQLSPARVHVRPLLTLALAAAPVVIAVVLAHQKFVADSTRPAAGSGASVEDYMNFGK